MITLFVGGEGPHELGKWAEEAERRSTSARTDGVLAALFRRARPEFEARVVDGRAWRKVPKFRAGEHAGAEERTLRGLALLAGEAGADALLWLRDTDGDASREEELLSAARRLKEAAGDDEPAIIGGVARPCLEAWGVALAGRHASPETLSTSAVQRIAREHSLDTEERLVELTSEADLEITNAASLRDWVTEARQDHPRLRADTAE